MLHPTPRRFATTSLSLALVSACAPRPGGPADQVAVTPTTVQVQTPDAGTINLAMVNEDRAESHILKGPIDQVWKMLPAVFGEMQLPVNLYVDKDHQIGTKGARFRGRIGKTRMAQYVTCGSDITGEDKANSYEVTLDVMSAVGAVENNQTNLLTRVTASGRPLATSGEPVRCTSTGLLERRIANAVTLKLGSK